MPQTISVVIPTHDDARTLPRTVASVLDQERPADEIIVVNDGGEDPRACLGDAAERVRVVTFETNRGVSAARNVGLAESSGAAILLLDSDDIISPDFLRLAGKGLEAHPEAAFCIGDALRCPDADVAAADRKLPRGRDRVDMEMLDQARLFEHVAANSGFYLPSFILMNRARLVLTEQGELYETRLVNGSDFQLFLRTAMRHGAVRINDRMGIHRLRPGSLSKNKPRAWTCRYQSMDMLLAEDPVVRRNAGIRKAVVRLRGDGARKVAHMHRTEGRRREALQVLGEDLRRHFSPQSAYYFLRYRF